ncbi:glycosyltransferase family 4 protein [Streptacidiphilus sp. ASG 303]|uniref:glycosyltransferase family 4 protein n=1 Tax=Streptacidiphilus sp. ASG 303 TaxID=2896847 RepID=UPI001E2A383C|nr:glycosyltransferase family 4 protein [Streptacidiphilus sp. ASG 303]MCD0483747.1 glycosyltransferase family 4 protein [Streptacidiphilus sp. ASG 303]
MPSRAGAAPRDGLRVLVHLNNLALGGAQINAVDIARTLHGRGHHPVLFAQGVDGPAPLVERAAAHGLDLVVAGGPDTPHRAVRTRLERLARDHGSDLVHAWEVRAARNAYFGPGRFGRLPVLTTFYGVRMLRGMPRHQPLVLGLGALTAEGRAFGHRDLHLVEPPVDTRADAPGAVDGAAFRAAHGIGADEHLLVIVTRLVPDLGKDAGAELTVEAVRLLADPRVRLAVVGEGPSRGRLRAAAAAANAGLGREAVLVPGQMPDPRTAYAAADVVLGMGSSALRGLAHGKPVVVHGAGGYTAVHEPGPLAEEHASRCMYGLGTGAPSAAALAAQVRGLLDDPGRRARLSAWGREWVVGRFSLESVTTAFERLYRAALADPPGLAGWLRDAEQMARYEYLKPAGLRLLRRG